MEDFVPFKLAQKLKEKGFSLEKTEIYGKFDSDGLFHSQLYFNYIETMDYDETIAPTISQVLKWLREEKKLYVGITYLPKDVDAKDLYYAYIQHIGYYKKTIYPNDSYDNWEGAALNGIEYAIDNNLIL